MDDWLKSLSDWIVELVKSIFRFIKDVLYDTAVYIFKQVLEVVRFIVDSLPVADFLQTYNLQALWDSLHPTIKFFATTIGIPQGLLFIAAAVGVRLIRKLLTLFQW